MFKISVVISTYNPDIRRLNQTLDGLKVQTLSFFDWELIIVDNNSSVSFYSAIDLSWHPNFKIVKESNKGLTYARLRGFEESSANIIVMVDDDNILDKNYLFNILLIAEQNPEVGAFGGKSFPLFETMPPEWLSQFYSCLAIRDLGQNIINEKWLGKFPESAPIGAGMAIKKSALKSYIHKVRNTNIVFTDRKGKSLSSGGDNDIVLEILKAGWQTGYYPILTLKHIIPIERTKVRYLGRLNKDSTKSWIQLLHSHHINLWPKIPRWSVFFRKLKALLIFQPWKNEAQYIKYKGVCGMYEALGDI